MSFDLMRSEHEDSRLYKRELYTPTHPRDRNVCHLRSRRRILKNNTNATPVSPFKFRHKLLPKITVQFCDPDSGNLSDQILTVFENLRGKCDESISALFDDGKENLIDLRTPNVNKIKRKPISPQLPKTASSKKKGKEVVSVYAPYFSLRKRLAPDGDVLTPNRKRSPAAVTGIVKQLHRNVSSQRNKGNITKSLSTSNLTISRKKDIHQLHPNSPTKQWRTPQPSKSIKNYIQANRDQISKLALIGAHVTERYIKIARNSGTPNEGDTNVFVERHTPVSSLFKRSKRNKSAGSPINSPANKSERLSQNKKIQADLRAVTPRKWGNVFEFHAAGSRVPVDKAKVSSTRHTRNMKLYKSLYVQPREKQEIIVGVRSNRRFELQMQFRDRFMRS